MVTNLDGSELVLLSKEEQELIINHRKKKEKNKLLKIYSGFERYPFSKFSDMSKDTIKSLLFIHNNDHCAAMDGGHCHFCESGMYNKLLKMQN